MNNIFKLSLPYVAVRWPPTEKGAADDTWSRRTFHSVSLESGCPKFFNRVALRPC
jgi:hypothetical protein